MARADGVSSALNQLVEGDWGDAELILVDLPPGTGDVQLSLVQKSRPAGAVIVSTPQDLSLIDATRAIDLFGKTSVPVLGIIENMAGYQCPHCGETSDPFGQGGAEASAAKLGVPFLGRLPCRSACARRPMPGDRPPPRMVRRPTLLRPLPANCLPSWRKSPPESLLAATQQRFHKCR